MVGLDSYHCYHQILIYVKHLEKLFVNSLLIVLVVLFIVGIWAPILTLKKLYFVQNTFSIISGIEQLVADGQYALFLLITVFTLVLPGCKIVILFAAWNSTHSPTKRRCVEWLYAIGKWSMLDVFVVAVLITSVKLGALASVEIHYGLYVFASAVIMMMVATHLVRGRIGASCSSRNNASGRCRLR